MTTRKALIVTADTDEANRHFQALVSLGAEVIQLTEYRDCWRLCAEGECECPTYYRSKNTREGEDT